MITPFLMTKDIGGFNGFGLPPSNTNYSATLAAATNTTFTVPTDGSLGQSSSTAKEKLIAIIVSDPGASVWVSLNATAAIPVGASFAATASMLNPAAIEVKGGDVINCICTAGASISIRFYWIAS